MSRISQDATVRKAPITTSPSTHPSSTPTSSCTQGCGGGLLQPDPAVIFSIRPKLIHSGEFSFHPPFLPGSTSQPRTTLPVGACTASGPGATIASRCGAPRSRLAGCPTPPAPPSRVPASQPCRVGRLLSLGPGHTEGASLFVLPSGRSEEMRTTCVWPS